MKTVILAGGLGTRLAEETGVRPKPMVEIGGHPVLWHILNIYAAHGFNDFVIAGGYKGEYIKEMLAKFRIDGIIYHDAKTCPYNSNNRYGMPQRIEAETGIPSLVISGDLNDLRCISDEQTKTNIEAFIEQLEEGK